MPADFSYEEKLQCAKSYGFDYVELSIDETDEKLSRLDASDQEKHLLIDAMYRTNFFFRSLCLSAHRRYPLGSHDASIRARSLDIMQKAIHLASFLGIRIIQLAGYDVYYETGTEKSRAFFLENVHRAVDMAAAAGVTLGFETMETSFMDTVEKAMQTVRHINSPYLGVYPDLGNLTNAAQTYGISVDRDIAVGCGHIIAMHLKETVPGRYREVPFGCGHVDFSAGIQAAWRQGVRRFTVECWSPNPPAWNQEIAAAGTMMRALLDACSSQ